MMYEGRGHEVAAELEEAVPGREEGVVRRHRAVPAGERVDYREEIDGSVQEQEDDKESAADGLYEFLADG